MKSEFFPIKKVFCLTAKYERKNLIKSNYERDYSEFKEHFRIGRAVCTLPPLRVGCQARGVVVRCTRLLHSLSPSASPLSFPFSLPYPLTSLCLPLCRYAACRGSSLRSWFQNRASAKNVQD